MQAYLLWGALAVLGGLALIQLLRSLRPAVRARLLQWTLGGTALLFTIGLVLARRFDIAAMTGVLAWSILRYGRLGRWTIGGGTVNAGNLSKVRSRYFAMELNHETGGIAGRVISGRFARRDLMELGQAETGIILDEVLDDPDSLALLETWLDANRAGWRDYFDRYRTGDSGAAAAGSPDSLAEARDALGVRADATPEEIRAAHREGMKRVHPDHGGTAAEAARLNEARDVLLRHAAGRTT
jgi:hypothetical protein